MLQVINLGKKIPLFVRYNVKWEDGGREKNFLGFRFYEENL